jgi:hypothetical protein
MPKIKVTKCAECPMLEKYQSYDGFKYNCKKSAFISETDINISKIHPNCTLKGQSINYIIQTHI